jgi:hypothetical protein
MKEIRILGILLTDRTKDAPGVQHTLTKFGNSIKTRLGVHEVWDEYSDKYSLILLELTGDHLEWDKLESELLKFSGIQIQKINFEL